LTYSLSLLTFIRFFSAGLLPLLSQLCLLSLQSLLFLLPLLPLLLSFFSFTLYPTTFPQSFPQKDDSLTNLSKKKAPACTVGNLARVPLFRMKDFGWVLLCYFLDNGSFYFVGFIGFSVLFFFFFSPVVSYGNALVMIVFSFSGCFSLRLKN